MITLGIILLILSLFVVSAALKSLGIILIVVGIVLALLGGMGRSVGGRRHYW
jgi:Na+/H+ antiporter NhaD/arsenite permease-like protein